MASPVPPGAGQAGAVKEHNNFAVAFPQDPGQRVIVAPFEGATDADQRAAAIFEEIAAEPQPLRRT